MTLDLAISADRLLFDLRSHRRELVAAKAKRDRLRAALGDSQQEVEVLVAETEQLEAALLVAVRSEAGEALT